MGSMGSHAAELKSGDTFPNLGEYSLEGTIPDLKGKVVLVDLWASWCGPCKKAFPVMKELHEKFSDKGLVIVAVSLDENKKDMDDFLKKSPVPFLILRDASGKLAERLGVSGIPASFIVGKDGKLSSSHTGFSGEESRRNYLKEISKLTGAAP